MSVLVSPVVPGGRGFEQPDNLVNQDQLPNEVLYGRVAWLGGLDIFVTDWGARINGVIYEGLAETVTLGTADGSNDRIDTIALSTTPDVDVIAGTPAGTPVKPDVDSDTQIEITFATVPASATDISGVTDEDVYLENTEWTSAESDSGTTINLAATSDPNTGSKHVEFAAVVDGDYITFTDSSTHSATEFENLIFAIKYDVANTRNQDRLRLRLYNSTTGVGQWVDLRHGTYGLDAANVSAYQNIVIPIEDFQLNGDVFDVLRFEVETGGSRTLSLNLDDIKFQGGLSIIIQGVSQEYVDNAVLGKPECLWVAVSDESTALSTGAGKLTFRMPYAFFLTNVRASVKTAPTGAAILVDINEGGSTILSTRITIDATEKTSTTATAPVISDPNLADDAEITIDIDQVGSTVEGVGLKVCLIGHQV